MTVLQFWQQELTTTQTAQAAAASALASAQSALTTAKTTAATDQKTLAATVADIASKRASLATATIPADATALVQEIAELIVTQRAQTGTLLDDQAAVADAQASADSAAATLARLTARIATIQAAIATATADDKRRTAYKSAIGSAPLSTLMTDAGTYLAGTTKTNADARIAVDFPAEILSIANMRHDTRTGRIDSLETVVENAEDALAAEQAANGGLNGDVASAYTAFARAEAAVADYVAASSVAFTKAKTTLAALEAIQLDTTGSVADVLTDAEKADLATLTAAGAAAEPTAEALDGNENDIFDAEDTLAGQMLTSIVANVDGLATDADIATARTAIDTARTAFSTTLAAFDAANKSDLDAWEAVIPDTAWQTLLDYQEAVATLTTLSTTNPATLATAMDAAEDAYATALASAALSDRRVGALTDAIDYQEARLDAARAALAARLPSAIRGDSY